MKSGEIQQLLEPLPHLPGVYRYFNNTGKLIYVGKAKDLRQRVSSYFTKKPDNQKTQNLLKNIHHVEFTIVDTERDAFLLEDSLIKNLQPRYNINLKDDKSYPYIVIKNESFARVYLTRKVIMDGSEYFGPFTNVGKIRELLELIRSIIPLRTNHLDLFLRITEKGKLNVSPQYYMSDGKREDEQILTEADYDKGLQQVRNMLKGKMASLIIFLRKEMKNSVSKMEFEKAEALRHKLEFIQQYKASSVVVNTKVGDLDVFAIIVKNTKIFVNYLMIRKGTIVGTKTTILQRELDISREKMLISAIIHIRKRIKSSVRELVVPFFIDYPDTTLRITVPKKGNKKKLLNLSLKNLTYFSTRFNKSSATKTEENNH